MRLLKFSTGTLDNTLLGRFARLLREATTHALNDPDVVAQLGIVNPAGSDSSRAALAQFLSEEYGEELMPKNLFISNGATYQLFQAGADAILPPNSKVLIEATTYHHSSNVFKRDLGLETIRITLTSQGIDVAALEEACKKLHSEADPKSAFSGAFYCIPDFHNPTGISYTEDTKRAVVRLAKKYRILVLSDDVYILNYLHRTPRPRRLRSIAIEECCDEFVASIGSFSKFAAPALRLGWIECNPGLVSRLSHSSVLCESGSLGQFPALLVTNMIQRGRLRPHMEWVRQHYQEKCDFVVNVLSTNLPEGISFQIPKGGLYLWMKLPPKWDSDELMEFSSEHYQIIFRSGYKFSVDADSHRFIRFCFGPYHGQEFENGVIRFRDMIKDYHNRRLS